MTDDTKLDLTSHNLPADKTAELLRLFPEIRTEGDKIDFDKLKLVLGQTVDVGKERYGMTWPGKADCFKTIQAPSTGTLLPAPEESVNFDTTENLIIEGDNLEVLKLLQKAYLGKVKMIYIDPPYNTGNDFIYPDNYAESLQTYLQYTGQVDAEGRKFGTNTDTDGRFHSRWLNMMYPRLYLARNLLRDDGVIFISIDDTEYDNLRKLCNEVFGEENFIASIVWQKRTSPDARLALGAAHDYILAYSKTAGIFKEVANLLPLDDERISDYKNPDNDPRGDWASRDITGQIGHATASQFYEITTPSGEKYLPPSGRCWTISEKTFLKLVQDGRIWFGKDGSSRPRLKLFLNEAKGKSSWTWWTNKEVGHNQEATKELIDLMQTGNIFDNPKPSRLIKRLLQLMTEENNEDLVLDFFSGSGTTAHATLELNKEDNGNRKFILVQLPEPTENKDFPTIADITKERVRRVIQKLNAEEAGQLPLGNTSQDRGFRVFKLSESNFKGWQTAVPKDGAALVQQLEMHIDHIREGRSSEDILYEILLKSGFPLTTPIKTLKVSTVNGKVIWQDDSANRDEGQQEKPLGSGKGQAKKTLRVYSIADGGMLICLEKDLTLESIRAMAELKPQRVVCLDAGFAEDQVKANAVQIFKTKDIVFKTV